MIQSVSFTSAAFESFVKEYLCFCASAWEKKKNAETIKFLEIFKKYVSENKIFFKRRVINICPGQLLWLI